MMVSRKEYCLVLQLQSLTLSIAVCSLEIVGFFLCNLHSDQVKDRERTKKTDDAGGPAPENGDIEELISNLRCSSTGNRTLVSRALSV